MVDQIQLRLMLIDYDGGVWQTVLTILRVDDLPLSDVVATVPSRECTDGRRLCRASMPTSNHNRQCHTLHLWRILTGPFRSVPVPFSHKTGTLRCLQKKMATYRHWSVSLWRDPDDVSHCWILSPDKTEWRLISATLCGWGRCFVADQLWLRTRIREEEDWLVKRYSLSLTTR